LKRGRAGLFVTLVAAIALGLAMDFHAPPRYDGAGYAVLGEAIRTGRGYREIARPGSPPHDHFPPGYPLVLAGLWSITGRSVVAAHLFSCVCTVVAVWFGWRWFLSIEARGVAGLLGLTLALNWTWILVGGAIQSEPLFLLLSMAAVNLARSKGLSGALLLGILLGLCVLTRHVGVCLAIAVLIDRALGRRWREVAVIGLTSILVVAPWAAWLVSVRRDSQASHLRASGIVELVASQALFYARRIPDALTGPFVEVATVFGRSRAIALVATMLALLVTGVVLLGWIQLVRSPRRRLAGLVPLVTLPLLLIWPFTEAGRFLIPLVPFLLVGAHEGLSKIIRTLYLRSRISPSPLVGEGNRGEDRRTSAIERPTGPQATYRNNKRIIARLIVLSTLPYSLYNLAPGRFEGRRRVHAGFDAACAWIATDATQSGPVLARHPGEVYWQTGRLATEPGSDDLDALATQIRDEHIAYILDDPGRYANAPQTPLGRVAAERPTLVRKVFEGPVSVYEVQPR
jgi:hypothetical protein